MKVCSAEPARLHATEPATGGPAAVTHGPTVACATCIRVDKGACCAEPELLKGILDAIKFHNETTFLWKLTANDQETLHHHSLALPSHVRCPAHMYGIVHTLGLLTTHVPSCSFGCDRCKPAL